MVIEVAWVKLVGKGVLGIRSIGLGTAGGNLAMDDLDLFEAARVGLFDDDLG